MNPLNFAMIPLEELEGTLRKIIREEVLKLKQEDLMEKMLSPEEVTKLFQPNITVGTLDNWAKKGLVKKHYIGRLTFYKYSELINSVDSIKKYQHK